MKKHKIISLALSVILLFSFTFTVFAGASKSDDCLAGNHSFDYISADCYPPLCTCIAVCSDCGYKETVISGDGYREQHSDSDGDGMCNDCGRKMPYVNCSHICHSNNIIIQKIILPILKILWNYFSIEEFCDCGTYHPLLNQIN